MRATRITGRTIGALLLLLGVGGAVGNFVLLGPVIAPPGFLANAAAHATNVSLSALTGLATGAISLAVAILAWPVLRERSESLALWLVSLATASFALAAVEQVALLSMLSLSKAYAAASGANEGLFQALRGVVAAARNGAHYVHLMFGGGVLLVFFCALWRQTLVPRALAGFGIFGCLLQIVAVTLPVFGQRVVFPMLAPLGIAMVGTAAWLLVKGFGEPVMRTSSIRCSS
jgi:hypothetical protein